jgi:L-alanine-DL-glutamate epimerase-like enolase superfamily enzyme
MRIQTIEIFKADLPMADPLTFTFFGKVVRMTQATNVVAKITADNGMSGYGSTSPVPPYHGMTQDTMVDVCKYLAPMLIGEDPLQIAKIHDLMDWAIVRADPAKCALDLALYDLIGKTVNLPVYALIGGKRRDSFFTTWTLASGRDHIWSHQEVAEEARKKYDAGYRGFEVHVGTKALTGFAEDVKRIMAIKEVCPDVVFDVDVHRNWTVKETIAASKELAPYNVWIEQPCETMRQMAEARSLSAVGLIADENCQNVQDLVEIVQLQAADAICLKPIKAGGLYKSWQMSTIAERFGMPVRIDGIPGESKLSNTASAHVALTLKQPVVCGVMQHGRLEADIVTAGGIEFRDGQVFLPDAPGLGCEVSEELMERVASFS